MSYEQLIAKLKDPMPADEYYKLLLTNARAIVIELAKKPKSKIAKDLGMSPQVFATAVKFISASV